MAIKAKPVLGVAKKLVLNKFILSLFGVEDFSVLSMRMNKTENEGWAEDGTSRFHHAIVQALPFDGVHIGRDDLLAYDQNIAAHTLAIQGKRPEPIRWKYFQYLALLFTEVYLDRFMNDPSGLLDALNAFCKEFNTGLSATDEVEAFTDDDLRKVAFWSATGSGKTLIMHMNIKQYLHHVAQSGRLRELNRILLVTPNEGLSQQHKDELELSGISCDLFSKQGSDLNFRNTVEIIEITRLTEGDGDKTVALDAFEGKNLVLVDEGHRGSSGAVWSNRRKRLAGKGFTFEYSATLGQAAAGSSSLTHDYAKSILFDYSYRYFYGDGYGKDYRILNLAEDNDEENRELYLTGCVLSFYQQKTLYKHPESNAKMFNIEEPLWVFVGGSVTKSTRSKDISDTIDIIRFLARFLSSSNRSLVLGRIAKLLSGDTGLLSPSGHDVFANAFPFIGDHSLTSDQIYDGILREIFNAHGNASLHVEELKSLDGEIALRLGDNEPFGVISVGDTSKVCKLLAGAEDIKVSERHYATSLFKGINKKGSTINILIGSKKFAEGWSSWRVSTMGLMNVGRSEGSQIIQLFGRGVRLRGLNNSLKRHSALLDLGIKPNNALSVLETLNIFGIRADYMRAFKETIEAEEIPTTGDLEEITIPVVRSLGKNRLKTIQLKEGLDFRSSGIKPSLAHQADFSRRKISLDYYPRLDAHVAKGSQVIQHQATKYSGVLSAQHIEFLDIDAIFSDLQTYKNDRGWFNLSISKDVIKVILEDTSWYEILIPQDRLAFDTFDKLPTFQNIASTLLKKYCMRFYALAKEEWEAPHREYRDLEQDDASFISDYKIKIHKSQQQIIRQLQAIAAKIEAGDIAAAELNFGQNQALVFDRHLYQPLLYAEASDVILSPQALNKGERTFVVDLKAFHSANAKFFEGKELFLLRNMSKGRGVGFFEAGNFYPDFVMWVLDQNKQYISFVDPKGILNLEPSDPKIEFYKTIKRVERQMGDQNVILNSFIVSVTPYSLVRNWGGGMSETDFAMRHILFQNDADYVKRIFTSMTSAWGRS